MLLDDIIAELAVHDRMQRIIWRVHEQLEQVFLPEERVRTVQEEQPMHVKVAEEEQFVHSTITNPAITYSSASSVALSVRYSAPSSYNKPDATYVHVPSWVKVHRAPFHHFGSSLFGLAYTATGDVHIREDLEGMQFTEVLAHEVLHQLYPSCSEQQVRQMVLGRFGSAAEIHTHVCRP